MDLALRLIVMLIARFKALGFLEWVGITAVINQVADSAFARGVEVCVSDAVFDWTGIRVRPEALATSFGWSEGISAKLGVPLRDITNRQMVKEDVLAAAAGMIAEKSGVLLTDVTDAEKIRADVMKYGAGRLATDAGIYLSDPSSIEAIKADLKLWGKQQAMSEVAGDLAAELNLKDSDGVRLRELLAARGYAGVKPVDLLKNANVLLVGYAREEFARAESITKKTARRLQLREAQSKFRRAHGNRQKYVPLGMTAVIG